MGGRGVTAKPPVTAGDRASWPQKARSSSPPRQPRRWDPRSAAGGVCGPRRPPSPSRGAAGGQVPSAGLPTPGRLLRCLHPRLPSAPTGRPAVGPRPRDPVGAPRRRPPPAAPGRLPALFPLCAAAFRPSPPAAFHVLLTLSLRRPPRVQAACSVRAAVVGPARSLWRLWDSAPGVRLLGAAAMSEETVDGTNGCNKVRTGTQNEAALLALMEKTGYNMVQENGQRKFGGPPPGWEGPPPPRGCEVFVGKIPRDMYEDELVPVFERAGKIYEFRLMMEFSGENRGYAFVMYTTKEEAQLAIRILNNYEIRPGKFIGVCVSLDNCRLFIGAIPKEKKKEEILDEMKKVTEGVVDVIVYPSATDKTKNRGFAFVEYESHRAAAMARRKLIPGTFQLWGHTIQVDWADPEKEVDEETMQRVKVLYVRNLMISTTEETIKAEFNKFKPGTVERVKKLRDYAFVHFFNREDAVAAMSVMNGKCIDGASIEVTLAKPVNKESTWRQHLNGQISPSSESLIVFANKEESHPKILGKPPTLPARLNGQHSPSPPEIERCTYPFFPGTKLTPISMYSLKSNHFNSAVMHLDYYCNKNNWAPPEYYLYSTTSQDGKVLLVYKIVIPAIANGSQSYFMPDKLCTTLEDAKELAAQFTLLHLDYNFRRSSINSLSPVSATLSSGTPSVLPYTSRPYSYPSYSLSPTIPLANGSHVGQRLYISNQASFF